MGKINGIENYSEQYKEYGDKVLENAKTTLNKIGIEVFPQKSKENENIDSCVIINTKKTESDIKNNKEKDSKKNNNTQWVRESLPTSNNIMSISSKLKTCSVNALGYKTLVQQNNESQDSSSDDEVYDTYDIKNAESDVSNVNTISNASDDEGNGNPLQTFFEKEVNEGFSSSNFAGTNYEKDITQGASNQDINIYSDNLYHKNNTSIIFGGTANINYKQENEAGMSEKFEYNAYAYGKYKTPQITYGAGVMQTENDSTNNINISIGGMHNDTGIYGIIQKDITRIPGLPTQTNTNINIGIGKASGMLDPDEYNKKNTSIEEISDIDDKAQSVESKESGAFEINLDDAGKPSTTIVNLIISDTDKNKEYGIKGGYIFRYTTKKQNYSFVMPYGQISNTSVDSNEGARLILGANAGQKANLVHGWEIKTKGVIEASRSVVTGSSPSDYVLANVNFKASKKDFDGEISAGGYCTNTRAFCKYIEAKIKYNVNDSLTLGLKGGYADSKFDTDSNRMYQIAAGVHYKF